MNIDTLARMSIEELSRLTFDDFGPIDRQRAMQVDIESLTRVEIVRWYQVFFEWSRGVAPKEERYVRAIRDSMAVDLRVVLTNGSIMSRDDYCATRLLDLYAARQGSSRSHICNLYMKTIGDDHILAVFDLMKEGASKKKVNSTLLRRNATAPAGLAWVHVHESEHLLDEAPRLR